MITLTVPIQFDYNGKHYIGYFESIAVSEMVKYDHWHLMIDKKYYGQFFYSQHSNCWFFFSNSGIFNDLSAYFEAYMTGWYGT